MPFVSAPASLRALDKLAAYPAPIISPLLNRTRRWPATPSQHALAALCALTLLPIRALLLLALLALLVACSFVVATCVPARLRAPAARLLVLPHLRLLCLAAGLWVTETGAPPLHPRVVVSNHVSGLWDAVYLLWRLGGATLFAERSNMIGVAGLVARALGVVGFDRSSPADTRARVVAAARDARAPPVLLFPEGCCSNGSALLAFKTGAFSPGEPVAPVVLRFPGTPDPSFCGPGPGLGVLVLRALASPWTPMEVAWLPEVHPPLAPPPLAPRGGCAEGIPEAHALAFCKAVRGAMAGALGVQCSAFGLEDVNMEVAAMAARMRPEDALVELEGVRALVRITLAEAKLLLGEFAAQGPDAARGSSIGFEQFAALLLSLRKRQRAAAAAAAADAGGGGGGDGADTPCSPATAALAGIAAGEGGGGGGGGGGSSALEQGVLRRLFDAVDVHHEGRLQLREVLVGLALLSDRGLDEAGGHGELLRLAFLVLDEEGRGVVGRDRLGRLLHAVWPTLSEERLGEVFGEAAGGGGAITEATFLSWAASPRVFAELAAFRERFLGLGGGDWLGEGAAAAAGQRRRR